MEYQILALDLDGTLTNSKKEISRPTLEALIDIQEQGKKVVLASNYIWKTTEAIFSLLTVPELPIAEVCRRSIIRLFREIL